MNDDASAPRDPNATVPDVPMVGYREWLSAQQTSTDEYADDATSADRPFHAPVVRAVAWTVPSGLTGLFGAYVSIHVAGYGHAFSTLSLAGIALMTWIISITCKMTLARTMSTDYPDLGMWAWITQPLTVRVLRRIRTATARLAGNGCLFTLLAGMALPGLFWAAYIALSIMPVAPQIWAISLIGATRTHISATIARYHRKGRP